MIKLADSGQRRNFINNLVDELSAEEKSILSSELGKSIADDVKKEALYLKGFYRNIDNLIDYDIKKFVASRNPILCEFIKGATKTSHFENQNRSYHLANVIDSVYKLANPTVVYPLAFINNLYIYIETGSRNVVDLIGAATGGGAYDTIVSWLKDQSGDPVSCPDGDMVTNTAMISQLLKESYWILSYWNSLNMQKLNDILI